MLRRMCVSRCCCDPVIFNDVASGFGVPQDRQGTAEFRFSGLGVTKVWLEAGAIAVITGIIGGVVLDNRLDDQGNNRFSHGSSELETRQEITDYSVEGDAVVIPWMSSGLFIPSLFQSTVVSGVQGVQVSIETQ